MALIFELGDVVGVGVEIFMDIVGQRLHNVVALELPVYGTIAVMNLQGRGGGGGFLSTHAGDYLLPWSLLGP